MRFVERFFAVGVWLYAVAALAAQPATKGKDEPEGPRFVVIIQDRVPVLFGEHQIGELREGIRAEIRDTREDWCRVRVNFNETWFEGWIRKAMTTPDTLAGVPIKLDRTAPQYNYTEPGERARPIPAPSGQQFLEVRVKFEPTEKSPQRVYLSWADKHTADVALRYGREGKSVPWAFLRRVQGVPRTVLERDEKREVLVFNPGEALYETFVFLVPLGAAEFDLVLKDVTLRVPIKR